MEPITKGLSTTDVYGNGSATTGRVDAKQLLSHFASTVYAAARRNAKKVASTKLRLYRNVGDNTKAVNLKAWQIAKVNRKAIVGSSHLEEIDNHPFLDIWKRPNPQLTGRQQQVYSMLYLQIVGSNYLHVMPRSETDSTPDQIYVYPAHALRLVSGMQPYYEVSNASANRIPFDQIVIQQTENLYNPYSIDPRNPGMSAVASIIDELDLQERVQKTLLSIMSNQGQPSCILTPKGEYSELGTDEAEALKRRYLQFVKAGSGGAMVLDSDMTYTPLNYKPTDLAVIQIMDAIELQVCKAFQIPAMLLRGAEGGSLASYQTAVQEWCDSAITDWLRETEDFINIKILSRFPDSQNLFVCYDDPTIDMERENVQVSSMLYTNGIITLNEVRAREGYENTEDGDRFKETGGAGMLDGLAEGLADDPEPTPDKPNEQEATTETAAASGEIQASALNGAQLVALSALIQQCTTGQIPLETARQLILAGFPLLPTQRVDAIIDSLIGFQPAAMDGSAGKSIKRQPKPAPLPNGKKLVPILRKAFAKQRASVLSWIGKSVANVSVKTLASEAEATGGLVGKCMIGGAVSRIVEIKGLPDKFIPSEDWAKELAEDSQPVIEILLKDSGRQLIQRVGASRSVFNVFNENVKARAETAALNLAQSTIDTTSLAINEALQRTRDALAEGLEAGESIYNITRSIDDIFDSAEKYRTFRIAQTEASKAHHEGLRDSAGAVNEEFPGTIKGFTWLTSSEPCPECEAMDGKFIELDGELAPLHPSCECTCLEKLGIEAGLD